MKSLPNSIARWMPGDGRDSAYVSLGTDGFGVSESRTAIRDFFEISPDYIAQAAISALYKLDKIDAKTLREQSATLNIEVEKINPVDR